jgi:nucleotide-binding universal stress UspA family protein
VGTSTLSQSRREVVVAAGGLVFQNHGCSIDVEGDQVGDDFARLMKILLAVDDSEGSREALRSVAERPWPAGTTVRVGHVIQRPHPSVFELATEGGLEGVRQEARHAAEHLVENVAVMLRERGLQTEAAVRDGDPASAIVEESKHWEADLIVVGSHGSTGITKRLLGGVAESVMRNAACSVEIIRHRTRP